MASSWNEDWEEIRNCCSRKYNITLWTNTTCENGLQPKWGLGGGLVWPSSSSIVTLWEFFLLIWILEACTRSIFLNMSTLQCNFFPGSAFVSQFPTFWGIGNPTDFQVSWGTWLVYWLLDSSLLLGTSSWRERREEESSNLTWGGGGFYNLFPHVKISVMPYDGHSTTVRSEGHSKARRIMISKVEHVLFSPKQCGGSRTGRRSDSCPASSSSPPSPPSPPSPSLALRAPGCPAWRWAGSPSRGKIAPDPLCPRRVQP